MATDVAILDNVVLSTAENEAAHAIASGGVRRSAKDILRIWISDQNELGRMVPLIRVRYNRAARRAQLDAERDAERRELDKPTPRASPADRLEQPPQPRWRFRHLRPR